MKKGIIFITMAVVLLLGSSFAFAAPDFQTSQDAAVNSHLQALPIQPIQAPDSPALREAAVDRYFQAVPVQSVIDDILPNMTKALQTVIPSLIPSDTPEEQRKQLMDLLPKVMNTVLNKVMKKDMLEKITREGLVKTFTAEEIDSMAKFYSSPAGKSIMGKLGIYMRQTTEKTIIYLQEIMPQLESEIIKSIEENLKADNAPKAGDTPSKPAIEAK
ncbi:MAG: DUF2059 domain-containing protein [Desulfuromonadales bacterium]|nr:DUF2059 domain-containing protein [Desulfuromonadales bacterium]